MSGEMSCQYCGESVDRTRQDPHRCDPERLVNFQVFGAPDPVAAFEDAYRGYLDSPRGRFEVWLATKELHERR